MKRTVNKDAGSGIPKAGARIIRANGVIEPVAPADGRSFSAEEINRIVGGHFEIVHTAGKAGALLVMNEDGKMLGLPVNQTATALLDEAGGCAFDLVVGDCLLCFPDQIE